MGGDLTTAARVQDEGYIPEETDAKIFEALLRIKSKDPAIYDPRRGSGRGTGFLGF